MKQTKKKIDEKELKGRLTKEQYHVLREKGTEPPFTGEYYHNEKRGDYFCPVCGNPLFSSDGKFDSGSGWPSFFDVEKDAVELLEDTSHGMVRTEVVCNVCKSHLGHLFDDGPRPTGKRYCINSASLVFEGKKGKSPGARQAAFAAGCFWGIQDAFDEVEGVLKTTVGYMGGHTEKPTYEAVCTDKTGHAETVLVEYDPTKVSYSRLLDLFWEIHDPTQINRQGPDVGTQYRSVIFTFDDEEKAEALASLARRQEKLGRKIVTEVVDAPTFWPAEEYHQHYHKKHGIGGCRV